MKIIDSIYSGKIHLNDKSVFEVLTAADHLQVARVVEQCFKYLNPLRFDEKIYCRVIMLADRHSLNDLKDATEKKMASMYKNICEKKEFLSDMNVYVLSALLFRDDLRTPSENFVFKSVMQWIKYRKGERLDVGAKAIGAVRLGLVDSKDVIEELDTVEMKAIPEINMLLQEALIRNYRPSRSSALALEKGKPRSMKSL
ncbi:PREDICTED: kelch-like protein 6 [Acropora digitifera]|uniref:kelch-like protein 6 n=1 Tax=Acropora digitifera TaxID=70779 RepID=UPI00077AF88F|nr:PREDICTED: kelch-like protein 6 [Acropora digitifera]